LNLSLKIIAEPSTRFGCWYVIVNLFARAQHKFLSVFVRHFRVMVRVTRARNITIWLIMLTTYVARLPRFKVARNVTYYKMLAGNIKRDDFQTNICCRVNTGRVTLSDSCFFFFRIIGDASVINVYQLRIARLHVAALRCRESFPVL